MLNNSIFYFGCIKKAIIGFGRIFSNIHIVRVSADASKTQKLKVPLAYGPKDKYIRRIQEDPTLKAPVKITLPRLAFEIKGLVYDQTSKVPKMNILKKVRDDKAITKQFSGVPYNLNLELNCLTKTQEDGLQIIEQIIPYFTPHYALSVNLIPDMDIKHDIFYALNNIVMSDNYDGLMDDQRNVVYTLDFTAKIMLYGPISPTGDIRTVKANIKDIDTEQPTAEYTASVPLDADPEGDYSIDDSWLEEF